MTKDIKWFKVARDIEAKFEAHGRVYNTIIKAGSEIETGRHPKQILLETGDIKWGLTTILKEDVNPIKG